MQVFILGMHRSGTSALARVLNLMGLYFGDEEASTGRSAENEKGFWERRDVRMINDSILFTSACDWDLLAEFDPDLVPDTTRKSHLRDRGRRHETGCAPALVRQGASALRHLPNLASRLGTANVRSH